MTLEDIARSRLINQRIAATGFSCPKDIVSHLGAVQAQDFFMSKWACGVRLSGCSEKAIDEAIDKAEILRTHVMRPTWHLVTPEDIHHLLELTAARIISSMKSRWKELELDEETIRKSNSIIEKALAKSHLTREEIFKILTPSVSVEGQRGSHLLFRAELEGIICSGAMKGKKQTYALLEDRAPKRSGLNREEALSLTAKKYFTSHGPATIKDFIWWSGLSAADAKKAVNLIKSDFIWETIAGEVYLFPGSFRGADRKDLLNSAFLLPAYDEYIISYKDREALLTSEEQKAAISNNGLFRPVVVINGKVRGIWKRTLRKDSALIETRMFSNLNDSEKSLVEAAAARFGDFLKLKAEVKHT